jgi:hypothetical protein
MAFPVDQRKQHAEVIRTSTTGTVRASPLSSGAPIRWGTPRALLRLLPIAKGRLSHDGSALTPGATFRYAGSSRGRGSPDEL